MVIKAMPPLPSNSKRTRSQLTLPEFNFKQLGRSPLKDARTAHRNTQHLTPPTAQHLDVSDTDHKYPVPDHFLFPSKEHGKRGSSPLKEAQPAKRRKHDGTESENDSATSSPNTTVTALPESLVPYLSSSSPSNGPSSPPMHDASLQHNLTILSPKDIPSIFVDNDQVLDNIPAHLPQDTAHISLLETVDSTIGQVVSATVSDGGTAVAARPPGEGHEEDHRPESIAEGSRSCGPHSMSFKEDPAPNSVTKKASNVLPNISTSVPFIDFNRIPPSPSKLKDRFHFVSIPSSRTTSSPLNDSDIFMTEPLGSPASLPPMSSVTPSSPSLNIRVAPSSSSHDAPPSASMSPLTPLPSTPHPSEAYLPSHPQTPSPLPPQSQGREVDSIMTDDDPTPRPIRRVMNIPQSAHAAPLSRAPSPENGALSGPATPSRSVNGSRSRPVTPSASISRLPRPSIARPSEAQHTEQPIDKPKEKEKEKKPRSKGKVKVIVPLGGRMTRSAALRQQEIKRKEEMRASSSSESCFHTLRSL